jgi:hypothetical protein
MVFKLIFAGSRASAANSPVNWFTRPARKVAHVGCVAPAPADPEQGD